jgi:perosamine synthetase
MNIPIYRPDLSGNEASYVNECLTTTWISSKGGFIDKFERSFSDFIGVKNVTSVSNGTVALHLAIEALGLTRGDEVIIPALTYVASANVIAQIGAIPVFVDSCPDTWQVDIQAVERAITPRTRAVMAVHLYGLPCDVLALRRVCDQRGLFLIEDCAEALGSCVGSTHVGAIGDIGTFSFYGNKTITTGEGGMVVARDPALIARCVSLKNQGVSPDRQYWHDTVAFNYRMTNICAAIGSAQMERISAFVRRKREIADVYRQAFAGSNVIFHEETAGYTHSYWMCSVLLPSNVDRDSARRRLSDAGIETRPVFYPVSQFPMYRSRYVPTPIANDIAARGINLPSWPGLSDSQVKDVAAELLRTVSDFQAAASSIQTKAQL